MSSAEREGAASDAEAYAEVAEEAGPVDQSTWLYERDGAIFGPVSVKELLEMLYDERIDAETPVSAAEGPEDFLPLRRLGAFRNHLANAEKHKAKRRAAEAEAARVRAQHRKQRIRWGVRGLAAALVIALLVLGGTWGWRRMTEAEAEAARAAEVEAEIEALLAGVSIEPPLPPVSDPEPTRKTSKRSRRGRRGRKSAPAAEAPKTGALSESEVHQGMNPVFGRISRCIKDQLRRDPKSVPGTIRMEFAIGNDGRSRGLRIDDRFLRSGPMADCFSKALGRAQWRAYEGQVRNVEYPITIRRPD